MKLCPRCGSITIVIETRNTEDHTRRRRKCSNQRCDYRYSTWETLVNPKAAQVKEFEIEASALVEEITQLQKRINQLKDDI